MLIGSFIVTANFIKGIVFLTKHMGEIIMCDL